MPPPSVDGRPAPTRTQVLAVLVGAAVTIGSIAALDPTTLRPGLWTVLFACALTAGALLATALLSVGRRWSDSVLVVLLGFLMALVVLSMLANQNRGAAMLNVVLLLPCSVYAAVYLSRRACRVMTGVLMLCLMVTMWAVTEVPLQWLTLVALPLLAFGGTSEVVLRLRGELEDALASQRREALTDPLTGLLNRRALQDHLARTPKTGGGFRTVLVLDIDHFKTVNDTFGHAVGDEVLRRFGAGLAGETRRDDVLVRMGGEEFLVLSTTPPEHAQEFAETLRPRAAQWLGEWSVTVSVGVVTASRPEGAGLSGPDLQAAIRTADDCVYAAKAGGRDRVVLEPWPAPHPRNPLVA